MAKAGEKLGKEADRLKARALSAEGGEAELFAMADSNFNEAIESYRHGRLQPALVMARSTLDAALFASRYPNGAQGVRGEDSWEELVDQASGLGFSGDEIREMKRIRLLGSHAVHAGSRYNRSMQELAGLGEDEKKRVLDNKQMFTNEKMALEALEKTADFLVEIRKRTMEAMKANGSMGIGSGIKMETGVRGYGGKESHKYIDALLEKSAELKIIAPVIDEHYARKLAGLANGKSVSVITTPSSSAFRSGGGGALVLLAVVLLLFSIFVTFVSLAGWILMLVALLLFSAGLARHGSRPKSLRNVNVKMLGSIPNNTKFIIGVNEAIAFSGDLTYASTHESTEQLEIVKGARNLVTIAARFNELWKREDTQRQRATFQPHYRKYQPRIKFP
ncbi:MAG: hypothetical protein LVQ95_01205 [Candidatus Micrarchaeales archaeon]|nr:hypothetical protein [Candidatus Micrarchaeales archaeon]